MKVPVYVEYVNNFDNAVKVIVNASLRKTNKEFVSFLQHVGEDKEVTLELEGYLIHPVQVCVEIKKIFVF